jgi:hypothetical protein
VVFVYLCHEFSKRVKALATLQHFLQEKSLYVEEGHGLSSIIRNIQQKQRALLLFNILFPFFQKFSLSMCVREGGLTFDK